MKRDCYLGIVYTEMSPLHMPKNELVQVLVGQAAYSLHMGLMSTNAGNSDRCQEHDECHGWGEILNFV